VGRSGDKIRLWPSHHLTEVLDRMKRRGGKNVEKTRELQEIEGETGKGEGRYENYMRFHLRSI